MNNFGVFFHVYKCVMYFKLRIFVCFFNYKHFLVRNILGFLLREDLERSGNRMGEYRPLLPSSWGAGLRGFRRLWGLSRGHQRTGFTQLQLSSPEAGRALTLGFSPVVALTLAALLCPSFLKILPPAASSLEPPRRE